MGSRMFLLLVLVPRILTDRSQGVPETREGYLIVNTLTDASAIGEVLTTPNPINLPKQVKCKCEGKERKLEVTHCLCQKSTRLKHRNWRKLCQRTKNKNLKKCSWFSKKKDGSSRIKSPSVPI